MLVNTMKESEQEEFGVKLIEDLNLPDCMCLYKIRYENCSVRWM